VEPEVIADTGPILHLHQIGHRSTLQIFEHVTITDLVADELRVRGIEPTDIGGPHVSLSVTPIPTERWEPVLQQPNAGGIQPADAQVFALAQDGGFQHPVLTDDLALRRLLEAHGGVAIGSIGVLVRAYTLGQLRRRELEEAVDALFDRSTLHLSRAFRVYVRRLLDALP
jgi:predicted nucleic acid-binding protein